MTKSNNNLSDKEVVVPALDHYAKPGVMSQKQMIASQAEYFIMRSVNRAAWVFRSRGEEVWHFMNNLQMSFSFEGLAIMEGQQALQEFVFNNTFNREFLKTIEVGFTSMHSEWHNHWNELLYNIAYGIGYTPISGDGNATLNMVPEEITSRAYSTTEIAAWLQSNNWAAILVMVKLWGVVPDEYRK